MYLPFALRFGWSLGLECCVDNSIWTYYIDSIGETADRSFFFLPSI